jgi:hypothetical protein
MRIRKNNIANLEAAKVLTSCEPMSVKALQRWHAVATRVVEVYGEEFQPIAARFEREIASLKRVEGLKVANRKLKLLRAEV